MGGRSRAQVLEDSVLDTFARKHSTIYRFEDECGQRVLLQTWSTSSHLLIAIGRNCLMVHANPESTHHAVEPQLLTCEA